VAGLGERDGERQAHVAQPDDPDGHEAGKSRRLLERDSA
jgi:hypothetical protein